MNVFGKSDTISMDSNAYNSETTDVMIGIYRDKNFYSNNLKLIPIFLFIINFLLFYPIILETILFLKNSKIQELYLNKYTLKYPSSYLDGSNIFSIVKLPNIDISCIIANLIFNNNSHTN